MSIFAIVSTALSTAAETAQSAAHHGAEEAASAGLPQLDPTWWPSQLFWLIITFGFLYWVMAGKFLPALGGAIEERRDRVADDLDQAGDFKRQAEEAEAAYNQSLADAKAKAQGIAADTRAAMDTEIAELQAETDSTLDKQIAAAEARISEMKMAASAKVRDAATETASAIVETLIDEVPTSDALTKAIGNASA